MVFDKMLATQRPVTIKLANGDIYVVTHLECKESLSNGLYLLISLCCHNEIDEDLNGKPLQVIYRYDHKIRNYNALVYSITITGYDAARHLFFYNIVGRDPLALLDLQQQRRIFQNMTTRNILESIFRTSNISSWIKFSVISNSEEKKIFCTQMYETDLAFVQYLMAREGWHYHVDHSTDEPVVIIADSNQAFDKLPEEQISWLQKIPHFQNLHRTTNLGTSRISLMDYSMEGSQIIHSDERQSVKKYSSLSLSSILYGRGYQNKNNIQNAVKLHMESIDSSKDFFTATSDIPSISVGKTFNLIDHPLEKINQKYTVTDVVHTIDSSEKGKNVQYKNSLKCRPTAIAFRQPIPERKKVYGLHTATVSGPENEEIYSDKIGRIKVHFHWDSKGNHNENSSCWLPVLQTLAGKGFGLQFLPRVGHKVLVQYIEGDPDNPVVVGSLYSHENDIPWTSATTSGIKTRTTPQGNSKQGNELRFDDQKNNELIFVHAEKDLMVETNNNYITTVKGKNVSRVEKNFQLAVKDAFEVSGDATLSLECKEKMSLQSAKDIYIQAEGNSKTSAKSVVSLIGETIEITGTNKINLTVGGNKIEISNAGIKINATKVSISSIGDTEITGATINIEGKAKAALKGVVVSVDGSAMTEVKSTALVNIQGSITKIN